MYIDPGDNEWTRWIDGLEEGDPVAHTDGRIGTFRADFFERLEVEIDGKIEVWGVEDCDRPANPELLALAASMPEDL